MSCHKHGFHQLLVATCVYHPSLWTVLLDHILCAHRAAADKFWLVVHHLFASMIRSIGECRSSVRSYFTSSVPILVQLPRAFSLCA